MNSLNSVLIEGNLVRDPEFRTTAKGTAVCEFGIASNRRYKDGGEPAEEVSFFDVETWGKLAETVNAYCKKGRGVRVVGRLKQSRWQDDEGKNRSKVFVVAEHVEFGPVPAKEAPPETDIDF
jgi:single-strand DNA-binding protein